MSRVPLDVTATVCNYNGEAYLADCVNALLAQTRPPRRIVVYDNASEDRSVALLRELFPEVEVVEMGENGGPCPARNRALREADTEWVLQVDNDAILEPECLVKLWAQVEADSAGELACVMPRAVLEREPGTVHYDGGSFHYAGIMTLRNFFQPVPAAPEEPLDVDAAIAMALLLHRETTLKLGAYHPDYFILFEDHDLSFRLRAAGRRIRLVPDARVLHREGTAGISYREGPKYPKRRVFLHSRNRWMLMLRNHSLSALLVGAPGIAAYDLVWFGFAIRQGCIGPWLRGKGAVLGQLSALLRQRRELRRHRVVGDRGLLGAAQLTHAPMVNAGAIRRLAERSLSGFLRGWWSLVRWMVSR